MTKFIVTGDYCAEVLEKRGPHRQAHLDRLKQQKEDGVLVTIGPTKDLKQFFAIYDASSEDDVHTLIEGDPYWQNGIWTSYQILEWIQAI
ncbi:YciI family protein [Candidatus Synechococcus calcipolaris G9]|uniref:YciI family protein n=1 Tax=Candidatus Synechococcus calcipolaris G9 TaxID=1497997 RepID=A0ABT6F2V9_9SYNE|nr:YciI family protein [Candidatus Synechococcus calcipolaris]MDG2992216.1 YciI family protein [Candidatus Synechococcus calcipolaris G9]